jgi:hypothetical protein
MKPARLIFVLIFLAACSPLASTQSAPTVAPVTQTVSAPEPVTVAPAATTLYISATMHIETKSDSWPQDTESFLAFLEQTTTAGLRWSIGGDIGWLEGDPRAQEIVQRSAALGVQWDVHAHKKEDLAKVASILAAWGVTPTGVVSGLLIPDLDYLRQPLTYQGYTWTPQVIWGGVECPGHKPGCDDLSVSLYRPASSAQYKVHDPNGNLVTVVGGTHTLADGESLAAAIASGPYNAPVIGYTLMFEPETLRIAGSDTDDITAILAFVARVKQYPFVRFATIEETAQAWVAAGGVPIQIEEMP